MVWPSTPSSFSFFFHSICSQSQTIVFRNQLNLAKDYHQFTSYFCFFLHPLSFQIQNIRSYLKVSQLYFSFPMRIRLVHKNGWFTYSCSHVSWDLYPAGSDYIFQCFFLCLFSNNDHTHCCAMSPRCTSHLKQVNIAAEGNMVLLL